jgi:ornithine decarboxylase
MNTPKFTLSKNILLDQLRKLQNLNLKISYSYKTNKEIGNLLQKISDVDFSIHSIEEVPMIKDKSKIWFFTQANSLNELTNLLEQGIKKFVIDNELDLNNLLTIIQNKNTKIYLSLRMKFQEHRVGTGKYFVYGLPSKKISSLISELNSNPFIEKIGIHLHRKSQNTSEWEITSEIQDSLSKNSLEKINFINLGGGLPTKYKNYSLENYPYIFDKLSSTKKFLDSLKIETHIEPGRFLASPPIKLITKIIQIQEKNIIINTSIYRCALDTLLTGTKLLVFEELSDQEQGDYYLIKGNSPTRDDIFRYKVKLKNPQLNDKIIFLNAGAYNYTTDFFGYKKIPTEIID